MAKRITECGCCKDFKGETRGRVTSFVLNGVTHYLPEMWIVGASRNLSHADALFFWADQCEMTLAHDAKKAKAA